MMNNYDTVAFDREIRAERTRERKLNANTKHSWRVEAYGSKEVYSSSMDSIYEAYNEYKSYEW